jgi:hypothetical protein
MLSAVFLHPIYTNQAIKHLLQPLDILYLIHIRMCFVTANLTVH